MCIFILPSHCPFNTGLSPKDALTLTDVNLAFQQHNQNEAAFVKHISDLLTDPKRTYIGRCFNWDEEANSNPFFCTNPALGGMQNELAATEDCEECTTIARHWHRTELLRLWRLARQEHQLDSRSRSSSGAKSVRISSLDEYIEPPGTDGASDDCDDGTITINGAHKHVRFSPRQEVILDEVGEAPSVNDKAHVRFSPKQVVILDDNEVTSIDESLAQDGHDLNTQPNIAITDGAKDISSRKDAGHIPADRQSSSKHVGFATKDEEITLPELKSQSVEELFSTLIISSGGEATRTIHCPSSTSSASDTSKSSSSTSLSSLSTAVDGTFDITPANLTGLIERPLPKPLQPGSEYAEVIDKYNQLAHDMLGRCNNTSAIHEQRCACMKGQVVDKRCGITRDKDNVLAN
ncbi:uncharacterized protein AB675_7507 [Cyphellophora attinorum]|uniref:Uncharacterized protein n=1 Tax=Cyphellophora attinorum TaxID=1664694 RepID=A0A0N0NMD8_9EURO|nr:uncharacterized protein AB675_7507 [Phialophora attinorum]KPI40238.1 hypothetical protein AB675_7507 [Phialophora attinorum]